jgi:hypothetical protein
VGVDTQSASDATPSFTTRADMHWRITLHCAIPNDRLPDRHAVKRHNLTVAEHPLQKQIADALRLEIAPPGKMSRDGVVWWSVDHASYAGAAPGARPGRGIVAGCAGPVRAAPWHCLHG